MAQIARQISADRTNQGSRQITHFHLPGAFIHHSTMTVRAHRVNGELLSQHIGDKIILLGSIINVSANGTNLEMKTSDSMVINVTLSNPFDGNATGYAEVHGIAKSKTTVACTNLIQFPPEMTSKFEMDQYNDLIVLSHTLGPNKWKMSRSNSIAQTVKS